VGPWALGAWDFFFFFFKGEGTKLTSESVTSLVQLSWEGGGGGTMALPNLHFFFFFNI
jgi:hypothetical protein